MTTAVRTPDIAALVDHIQAMASPTDRAASIHAARSQLTEALARLEAVTVDTAIELHRHRNMTWAGAARRLRIGETTLRKLIHRRDPDLIRPYRRRPPDPMPWVPVL